ncbi:DUF4139 domain-containing protein [Joostella sp. CR20]|uniref:DUF4139 domain-containing protein n=1 Tax=Joostella sp. CR20 TaxID=2804312 RepID=UPI00313F17A1
MYKATFYFFLLIISITNAQNIIEKDIETTVSDVTVFLDGAQIQRNKSVYLEKGIYNLKFTKLSPYIQEKSITLGAENGNLTILSINNQIGFEESGEKPSDLQKLELELKQLEKELTIEQTHLEIVHEDIAFLKENRNLNGKNEALSISNLKAASDFFNSELTALKLKEIERYNTITELNKEITVLRNRINEFSRTHDYNLSEILVKIENKTATEVKFTLNYLVKNASWYPSYDLKASEGNDFINITHKANVRQDTKIDWKDVNLKFSSSNPNISGTPPTLKTYYLDYNLPPPSYNDINEVSGVVYDENGTPLPGVNILIENTSIGTSTDFDGKYTLSIPNKSKRIVFSYIGYQTLYKEVNNNVINAHMQVDNQALDEVVVVGYGNKKIKNQLSGAVKGVEITDDQVVKTTPEVYSVRNTSINFHIDKPYSIASDNKNNTIEMTTNEIKSNFYYQSTPKLLEEVFLIAEINDWIKYDLLDGEANIFYENTYVGKTVLELNSQSDTLDISFGRDQNINIHRKRNKNLKSKKFLGSNVEELVGWTTTIKNNKNKPISLKLIDQIPVSNRKEIEVEVTKSSNGKINHQTGEVQWDLTIKPNKSEDIDLNYNITYPKNTAVYIE